MPNWVLLMANILVTGGLGFIGSNLSDRLLRQQHQLTIIDNLSRPGVIRNLEWLRERHGAVSFSLIQADVVDIGAHLAAVEGVDRVYHLAGQVAVTASLRDPRADFHANALGTFNVLEAVRTVGADPVFVYSSTNKVYGGLEGLGIIEQAGRYGYANLPHGISEQQPVDFCSPYGCSKGAGDQYVRDYHRTYGLRTVVLRQSCIYGYRQFGVEDQGWLAWFTIAALRGHPITVNGDGKQVRDVLFIDDLLDAYEAAVQCIDRCAGQVYNVGGGPQNTISIWAEFGPMLERLLEHRAPVAYERARPGDQLVYVSDIRKAGRELGWRPRVSASDGIRRLVEWIREHPWTFNRL